MASEERGRREASKDGWPEYFHRRAGETGTASLKAYYGAGCLDPETPMGDVPMLAMDMETTGLDETRHAIVSIGVVPFDLRRIRLGGRLYWVVKPPRPLDERSITFHHITHSDIETAPDLQAVLPILLTAMAGRIVVVHYRNIERPFLDAAVRARLGEPLLFPVIDTMALEARLHRISWRSRVRGWLGQPPVSIRLGDSRTRYGLPGYTGHHALHDALATAELLQAQVNRHFSPETPLGELWT